MTLSVGCREKQPQHFTFPRRELFQNIASAALLFLVPRTQPALKLPIKYPAPSFHIGDKVASHWPAGSYDEDDVDGVPEPEIGEVVGICWHPVNRRWEYQINWVSGSSGSDWMYPCFEADLSDGSLLERLS